MFDPNVPVLVVDDMFSMRKLVSKVLRDLGFKTIVDAADGNLAMAALNEAQIKFGLVLSDWNMPNCSGLELLKRVRSDKALGHLPFILITAESELKQIQEAAKLGVDNYIVKPFTAETLGNKLKETHAKLLKRGAA